MNILLSDDIERMLYMRGVKKYRLHNSVQKEHADLLQLSQRNISKEKEKPVKDDSALTIIRNDGKTEPVFDNSIQHTQKIFSGEKVRVYPNLEEIMNLAYYLKLSFKSLIGLIVKRYIEELYFGLVLYYTEEGPKNIPSTKLPNWNVEWLIDKLICIGNNVQIIKNINLGKYDFGRSNKIKLPIPGTNRERTIHKFGYNIAMRQIDFRPVQDHISYNRLAGLIIDNNQKHVLVPNNILTKLKERADELDCYRAELEITDHNRDNLFYLILEMINKNVFEHEVGTPEFDTEMGHHEIELDSNLKKSDLRQKLGIVSFSQFLKPADDKSGYIQQFLDEIEDAIFTLFDNIRDKYITAKIDLIEREHIDNPFLEIRMSTKLRPQEYQQKRTKGKPVPFLGPLILESKPEKLAKSDILRSWEVEIKLDQIIFKRSFFHKGKKAD